MRHNWARRGTIVRMTVRTGIAAGAVALLAAGGAAVAVSKDNADRVPSRPAAKCKIVHAEPPVFQESSHMIIYRWHVIERCRGQRRAVVIECDPLWDGTTRNEGPPADWPYGIWDGTTPVEVCDGKRAVLPSS